MSRAALWPCEIVVKQTCDPARARKLCPRALSVLLRVSLQNVKCKATHSGSGEETQHQPRDLLQLQLHAFCSAGQPANQSNSIGWVAFLPPTIIESRDPLIDAPGAHRYIIDRSNSVTLGASVLRRLLNMVWSPPVAPSSAKDKSR